MEPREWLINLRNKKELSQEQAALICGISRGAYSNVERGRGLSVDLAKKIAKGMGFDWQIFFDDKCAVTKQNKKNTA